jgi:hypothetical protein
VKTHWDWHWDWNWFLLVLLGVALALMPSSGGFAIDLSFRFQLQIPGRAP